MWKGFIFVIFLFLPVLLFSQDNTVTEKKDAAVDDRPVLAVLTDIFDIKSLSFNKRHDPKGRGEELQVEFQLYNNTNLKQELYIFVVGTYEKEIWSRSSLYGTKILPQRSEIIFIETFPPNNDNFRYEKEGVSYYEKYPKDYKVGVNPLEGKPYLLDEDLIVRTSMVSPYRKNFLYFNHVTLMIYGDDGELIFRQIYRIDSYRK